MSLTQGVPASRVPDLYDVQMFPELMVPEMYNQEPQLEDMLSPPYSLDDPTDQQNNIDPNAVISALAPQGLADDSADSSSEAPADAGVTGTSSCSADSGGSATGDCSGNAAAAAATSSSGNSGVSGATGDGGD